MCGIAGWVGKLQAETRIVADALSEALRHRGPDGSGVFSDDVAVLVHRRLAILDLSSAGAQPIGNETGHVQVIFNGEIYNHRALREQLVARGHVFRGRADSEVLPHLYEEHGAGMFSLLRGMFAIALYDARERTLLLARDRFGIKPLFHARVGEALVFASELNAFLRVPGFDRSPDPQAISDYLALTYIPAPLTFYQSARAVLPGHVVEIGVPARIPVLREWLYHEWAPIIDGSRKLSTATDKVASLITTAVASQMESDVPLAALLSGGIDSSLVTAAAQAARSSRIQSFNVRFPDRAYDETWAARAAAEHVGTSHTTLDIQPGAASWDQVTSLLRATGQPFADSSLFALNAVSRLMRQHVKVALSGDGGDEAFGGYASFSRLPWILRWRQTPNVVRSGVQGLTAALAATGLVGSSTTQRFRELAGGSAAHMLQTLYCWIRSDEHQRLTRGRRQEPVERWFAPSWDTQKGLTNLDRLSLHLTEVCVRLVMPNDYLFKVDAASMQEGLELRVPMLDEELFEYGLALPHRLKAHRSSSKRVLRSVAWEWLPREVADKPKWGFSMPVDAWMPEAFRSQARELVNDSRKSLSEFADPVAFEPWLDAFAAGRGVPGVSRAGLYTRALMLMSLQIHLNQSVGRSEDRLPVSLPSEIHAGQ